MITSVCSYLPTGRLTNTELSRINPKWTAEGIYDKTGIRERTITTLNETALDLGEKAAKKLSKQHELTDVDLLLFCTQFPDYPLPPNSTLLHSRLGIKTESAVLDFTHACSGYIYGLFLANAVLNSDQAKSALIVTGDTYTRHLEESDFSSRSIFGDAGTATLLTRDSPNRLSAFAFGTDGTAAESLMCKGMGERALASLHENSETSKSIYMNGPEVFNFTLSAVPEVISRTCKKSGIALDDFDWVVFHQANAFMLEHLRKKLAIRKDRFVVDFEDCGNTVSSTIPIVLERLYKKNKIGEGNRILLAGFGVGLSWASCVLEIGHTK